MRHLVLVGLMGTGKTTVGRLVAEELGWPLRDSDADIEAGMGVMVRELHEEAAHEPVEPVEPAAPVAPEEPASSAAPA